MGKGFVWRHAAVAGAALLAVGAAHATNGMNMEGYGPIATGMGGASQAYDNGTAAMANNPATLSLMGDGTKAEVAVGLLGPRVSSSSMGMTAKSGGTAYVMPAIGWTRTNDRLTYGIGVFAQGGMGTEYDANSFLAMGTGQDVRSELGVGKVIFPLSYKVSEQLSIGGSLDVMWAGLDVKMAMTGAQAGGMVTGGSAAATFGTLNPSFARIDFSNGSDFTGAAKAAGLGAKLGFTYTPDKTLRIGGSYQPKSRLNDMKTSSAGATLTAYTGCTNPMQVDGSCTTMALPGQITVSDFQWPATTSFGMAWQQSDKLMLAADVKYLQWKNVMDSFKMTFDSAALGGNVSFALPQNWKNQTVLLLGAAYKVNDQLTLRGGLNLASNPVPDATVNPLFPATVKNHATVGFGYALDQKSSIQASMTIAPTVKVVNSSGAMPVTVSHRQTNFQLMYSASY